MIIDTNALRLALKTMTRNAMPAKMMLVRRLKLVRKQARKNVK